MSGTDELNDFRTSTKILANVIYNTEEVKLKNRRFLIRRITEKVLFGNPTLLELMRWYPRATIILRNHN